MDINVMIAGLVALAIGFGIAVGLASARDDKRRWV